MELEAQSLLGNESQIDVRPPLHPGLSHELSWL